MSASFSHSSTSHEPISEEKIVLQRRRQAYLRAYRPAYKQRTRRISITFHLAEYEELCRVAAIAGKTPSSLLRELFRHHQRQEKLLSLNLEKELEQSNLLIRQIGGILNTMACAAIRYQKSAFQRPKLPFSLEAAEKEILSLKNHLLAIIRHQNPLYASNKSHQPEKARLSPSYPLLWARSQEK
ncbi:MAG: hypothetical protein HQL69_02495 [Magnetococcales bacterium]|nr:hypothetical protein [Magnetococcales bacterium]